MYDLEYKLVAMKFIKVFLMGGIGAVIAYLTGFEPTITIVLVASILAAVHNYLKHI